MCGRYFSAEIYSRGRLRVCSRKLVVLGTVKDGNSVSGRPEDVLAVQLGSGSTVCGGVEDHLYAIRNDGVRIDVGLCNLFAAGNGQHKR